MSDLTPWARPYSGACERGVDHVVMLFAALHLYLGPSQLGSCSRDLACSPALQREVGPLHTDVLQSASCCSLYAVVNGDVMNASENRDLCL